MNYTASINSSALQLTHYSKGTIFPAVQPISTISLQRVRLNALEQQKPLQFSLQLLIF